MNSETFKEIRVYPILIIVTLLFFTGCSRTSSVQTGKQLTEVTVPAGNIKSPVNNALQENTEGAVSVSAQWMGEQNGTLAFDIIMNTHSVNLDQYDLSTLTRLIDDEGKEYVPTGWKSEPGGHHRQGTLVFPIPDTLKQGQTKSIKMIIKGITAASDRIYEWRL